VSRRLLIVFVVVLLVVGGGYAALALPFVWLPPQSGTHLKVLWEDPGASVPRVAETVAKPLANALDGLDGLDEVLATARPGRAEVALHFDARARNPQAAVRQRLASLTLPTTDTPIRIVQESDTPEVVLIISSDAVGLPALTRWTVEGLFPALRGLKPVGAIALEGAPEPQLTAVVDQRRLAGAGLAPEDIARTLRGALNARSEATHGPPAQAASLSALPLRLPSGEVTALGEFARFELRHVSGSEVRYDGARALRIRIHGTAATSERVMTEAVTSQLGWLRANGQMPAGVNVSLVEELRATRVHARRALQRAMAIGALATLAFFFVVTGSLRALVGRAILLTAVWGAMLLVLWITATPLSVPTLGGVALAIGPILAISYVRRTHAQRGAPSRRATSVSFILAGAVVLLTPWLFATGTPVEHYRGLLLVYASALGLGALVDALWAGRSRRRRKTPGGWRSQPAAWLMTIFEHGRRRIGQYRWTARLSLFVLLVSALFTMSALSYRPVALDAYRPLVFEWIAESPGAGALAREDARLARLLEGETGVRHRELTLMNALSTRDGHDRVRARLGIEPQRDHPQWRAQLSRRLAAGGLAGLRFAFDPDANVPDGLQVSVRAGEWAALIELAAHVAGVASAVTGVARVDERIELMEQFVLHESEARETETTLPAGQIDRALTLARGELVLGQWEHQAMPSGLRMRLHPQPDPPAKVLVLGERRDAPARYLRDLGEVVRVPLPRWLQLDEEGYVARLEVIPSHAANARQLEGALTRTLERIRPGTDEAIEISGRADVGAALGPAWRVALLATLTIMLAVIWSRWRGSEPRIASFTAVVAVAATLVTASAAGMAGAGPNEPYLFGLMIVFVVGAIQAALLWDDGIVGAARRPFGRRALESVVVTLLMFVGTLPLAFLAGAAGALLAPLAQVVCGGLLAGLAVNFLFLAAFPASGAKRHIR